MRRDFDVASDLRALQEFAQRVWSMGSRWPLGDLAWELGQVPEGRPEWRMALWETAGEVTAWGWVTLPDNLSLLVDPAEPALTDEVLDWAEKVGLAPVTVTVQDSEQYLVDVLTRRGYTADLGGAYFLAHSVVLSDLPPVPDLPEGFTVRPVAGAADHLRRVAVHREVWHPSAFSEQRYAALRSCWPYREDLDMVVEAPDGRFVAYCLGWYDEVNRVGQLEPVGTLAEYRRLGLSRAACLAVLRAFRQAGGEWAVVYARGDDDYPIPKQVYAALGFHPHARTLRYRQSA
jgi:ribosomal protein S18 acetylase RimI-like enzyme